MAIQVAGVLSLASAAVVSQAGEIGRELERAMFRRGTHADTAVIVRFADPVDARPLAAGDRRLRDNRLLVALKLRAERNRATIDPFLAAQGATHVKDLWIINGFAATLPAVAVKDLAAQPGVARIDLDSFVQGGRSQRTPPPRSLPAGSDRSTTLTGEHAGAAALAATARVATSEVTTGWNVAAVHAPDLWALGHRGQGVVVASMDTGVDLAHPYLRDRWRGGANSWFDPHGEEGTPYDALGHGTQALGVAVGGPSIGVAPAAQWIAVRLFDSNGRTSMSDIHRAFQWLMDPDGNPATLDAPDVVNASWALTGAAIGACHAEFSADIGALRSAGIAVVFAAGNDGPLPSTSSSPGNNPGAISVGSVDRGGEIARQSSRGPSSCDGTIFPRLVAPGVNIRTADLSYGGQPSYTTTSGSSLAAPHVAGVLALLAGAFPSASVAELDAALVEGARDLGAPGSENVHGNGLVDALSAFRVLRNKLDPTAALALRRH